MKKALVTGISGFVGSHLVELLIAKDTKVTGVIHPDHATSNIARLQDQITILKCDLQNKKDLEESINENFDYIFHLAAFSSPAQSFKEPKETIANNLFGELNLLELLAENRSKAKILIVGSADEYGDVGKKYLPVTEDTPLAPLSPYAVSKVAQDMLGLQFFLHSNLHIVRVRPFNHIGPRQSTAFAVSAFASQIASLEKNGGGTIKVGNLNSWRDFTDVRDMVRAYLIALEKGKVGDVYNLGSGQLYKIADILKKLISFSSVSIKVLQDQELVRAADIKKIACDFGKFKNKTGWEPKIPIDKTLFDTITYERNKL